LSGIDPDLRALAALLNNCQVVLNNLWGETVKAPLIFTQKGGSFKGIFESSSVHSRVFSIEKVTAERESGFLRL